MEGASRRIKRDTDRAVSTAWHSARFAREPRLKPLEQYLKKQDTSSSEAAMIAGLRRLDIAWRQANRKG